MDWFATLQENMKTLRKENNNETQEKFAEHLNVGKSTVSSWFKETMPSLDMIVNVAKTYDVSVDWLLGFSNIREIPNENRTEKKDIPKTYQDMIELIDELYDMDIAEAHFHPEKIYGSHGCDSEPLITMDDMYNSDMENRDIQWRKPEILRLKDTFLCCVIIQLYYCKKEFSPAMYQVMKQNIIEKYGQKELLNIDISNYDYPTIDRVLTKYKLYSQVDLETLWNDLNAINEQLLKNAQNQSENENEQNQSEQENEQSQIHTEHEEDGQQ